MCSNEDVLLYRVYSVSTDNIFIVTLYELGGYGLLFFMLYVGDGVGVSLHI
jgi:hypothetical protein